MIEIEPFKALTLSLYHNPGVYALLVGSGLSRSAGIPTGWEITLDLIRRLAVLEGASEQPDLENWYRDKFKKKPSYSEMLDVLAATPSERRAILHSYIEPKPDDPARRPTKAHHAIAKLVAEGSVRVIVTTNFDRLIENALREAGVEPTVIASDDALAGATPLNHARCTVVKVHGDYLDSRIKNTDSELEGYSAPMNLLLDEIFDRFGLLVVGWSGEWDPALRAALLRAPTRRYSMYWAARGSIGALGQDILSLRRGTSVAIPDADRFFANLSDAVDALRIAERPHPESAAVAIALAKRYCRDDRFALEWHELLHAEMTKVREYITGSEYPSSTPEPAGINSFVESILARSEILRRVCLVCGRWGTTAANRAVADAIRSLTFRAEPVNGFTFWIEMRDFGASLCFYWTLFGATARSDFKLIHLLMHSRIKVNDGHSPMVSELAITSLGSINWKFLKGLENRRTPGSDFLLSTLSTELGDIALGANDAPEVFDRLEMLITLEFAHLRLSRVSETGIWFWTPPGRYIWSSRKGGALNILKEFEDLTPGHPLLAAGLLGGSPTSAAAVLDAVREHFKKIPSW